MKDIQSILNRQPILLFDGECGFCNYSVKFVLNHERQKTLSFAALQSAEGKALREYFEIDPGIDSMILIKDHEAHIKSCAALRVTRYMKGLWPLMMVFILVPPFIRNFFYGWMARRRIRFFGRVSYCAMLTNEDQRRFLDREEAWKEQANAALTPEA